MEGWKNAARLEKTSHAGIIRIGFEGISQPHNAWSTPVSITQLKHCPRNVGNCKGFRLDAIASPRPSSAEESGSRVARVPRCLAASGRPSLRP
jgi:hypothetical protein